MLKKEEEFCMAFYLINGTFKKDMPQGIAFKEALEAHHAYWAPFMQAGKVLVSGPKTSGAGLLIIKCDENDDVQKIMNEDPFVLRGVATFEAMEFNAFYKFPAAEEWFAK